MDTKSECDVDVEGTVDMTIRGKKISYEGGIDK
jgi:hypothetical protein